MFEITGEFALIMFWIVIFGYIALQVHFSNLCYEELEAEEAAYANANARHMKR